MMILRTSLVACLSLLIGMPDAFAHGRSEEMIEILEAPPPDWLTIGSRIIAQLSETKPDAAIVFRKRSGNATNSRNRIQIPDRGIEIRVDYSIDWTGDNEAGKGVSLSPNGKDLLVNSGTDTRLYEILPDSTYREKEITLPHVTYDPGDKGFITDWSWAGENALVGTATITDFKGLTILENRLYVFHLAEKILSRVDLSGLPQTDAEILEVTAVGSDLNHLKILMGDQEFTVKADLKTLPQPLRTRADSHSPGDIKGPLPQRSDPTKDLAPERKPTQANSTTRWLWLLAAIAVIATAFRILSIRRNRGR